MVATKYSYDLTDDFTNGINLSLFVEEIDGSSITENFHVSSHGDYVDIIFDNALSGGDQTTLTNLVSAHTGTDTFYETSQITVINPKIDTIKESKYRRIATYVYPGNVNNTIKYIKVVSYMDSGPTSYDIRVTDKSNGTTIVTKNLTNTIEEVNDLGTLANIPSNESKLEISVQKNGGKKKNEVYIESISFYLG